MTDRPALDRLPWTKYLWRGLYCLLCLLFCLASLSQQATLHNQQFQQAAQLQQTLLQRQLDYTVSFLQRMAPAAQPPQETPPFIVAAGFQPLIKLATRERFEAQQSFHNRATYIVREYRDPASDTWQDSSAWFPAAARGQYLPLVALHPGVPENKLNYLLGLDLATDRFFTSAIRMAIEQGNIQLSKAFNYKDGRPGIALVKAIYTPSELPFNDKERRNRVLGVSVAFVDLQQMLSLPNDSPYDLHISTGSAVPALENAGSAESSWLPAFLQVQQQSINAGAYALPYTVKLRYHGSSWQENISIAGFLLSQLLLYLFIFHRKPPSPHVQTSPVREHTPPLLLENMALQAMDDAVMLLSEKGRVLYANNRAQALTGEVQPLGKSLDLLDFGIRVMRNGRQVYALPGLIKEKAKALLPHDCTLLDAFGSEIEIEGEFIPVQDAANVGLYFLLTFRHVGQLRQDMHNALKASEMKLKKHQDELARVARINTLGEISSGIAHEINQPLSAIMSYNEACLAMMDDASPDPVLLRISLVSSVRQANRAGKIIRRLRELATRKQAEVTLVQVNDALRSALDLSKHELNARDVQVTTDLADHLPQVMADSIQLEQVIINLIKNAIDAMSENRAGARGLRIFAYTERREGSVKLGIRDNGTGIPENVLPNIFDPFFSSKSEGMGLGLTISQTIIQSIGGDLAARNLETGGAEFSVTLPIPSKTHDDGKEDS